MQSIIIQLYSIITQVYSMIVYVNGIVIQTGSHPIAKCSRTVNIATTAYHHKEGFILFTVYRYQIYRYFQLATTRRRRWLVNPGKAKGELTTAASRTSESALRMEVSVFCNFKTNPHFGDISCARTPRAQALRSCRAPCPPTRNSQTAAADGPSCPQPSSYPKCR